MARHVNSAFVGITDRQTDPGAYSYSTVIGDIVGNTALVHDVLTGDNTPTTPIDHTGSGAGTPLGVPLGASAVIVSGQIDSSATRRRASSASTTAGQAYLFGIPIYLPEGETAVTIEIDISDPDGLQLLCKSTSWVDSGEPVSSRAGDRTWRGEVTGLTGGTVYFLMVEAEVGPTIPPRTWSGVSIYFPGASPEYYQPMPEAGEAAWDQAPVNSQASGGATILDQEDWDLAAFGVPRAIHAQLTDRLNKNQNALAEFMSGAPAGGNAEYTLKPTSGADPTSSAFHDHSKSTHSNEEEIDFPVLAVPLGAVEANDSGSNADYKTDNWGAPAATGTGKYVLASDCVQMPDFPGGTSTSRLNLCVLMAAPDTSDVGTATIYGTTVGEKSGVATNEATDSPSRMGTTPFYIAQVGGTKSVNRMDFAPGEVNELRLSIDNSHGGTYTKALRFVGYCWYFNRDD